MKLSTFLVVNAVVDFLYGVVFMLFPEWALGLFGLDTGATAVLFSRVVGAISVAFGVVSLLARSAGDAAARRILVPGLLAGYTLLFANSLVSQLNKVTNQTAWANVIVFGLFALACAYYMWTMSVSEPAPAAAGGAKKAPARKTTAKRRR